MGDLACQAGGEVRTGPFGTQLHKSDYIDDPAATPVVMPKDMSDGKIDSSAIARVDAEVVERLSSHMLRTGDIVLGRRGDIGRRAWTSEAEEGWLCGTGSMRISVNGSVNIRPRYLFYFLGLDQTIGWLKGHAVGATMSNLSAGVVQQLPVQYPSLALQDAIVEVLDSLNDLIENNRRRIEVLEEMARLLYREWFVYFRFPGHEDVGLVDSDLGPIPEGWEVGEFADLVAEVSETAAPEEIAVRTPVVGLEHFPRRSTTLQDWESAYDVGSRRKFFDEGDILFGKIRPYFHKVVDAPTSGCCSTDAIIFRPIEEIFQSRALAIASSDEFVGVATATSNGTRMPRANTKILMGYRIPHPTHGVEQAFSEAVRPMNYLRKNLATQNRVLREARDLLLPRLVSGELDVSELDLGLEAVGA
ncbi:restriction endonuclease subunit S [Candidatus Poriferisocius sp.]|uniref:restriction endonuclease subunit S n=1 Tax=Candidatus Poriferisocius sp. TaxID=3101276 RepID=UPI003B01D887